MSFNPRTHEGCDVQFLTSGTAKTSFNPRTHEGCDLNAATLPLIASWFQSTHPRRVRHAYVLIAVGVDGVSIHAPTKGATSQSATSLRPNQVSIHAPTKGATLDGVIYHNGTTVSIHAPTKGATRETVKALCLVDCFNPRTHEGCDVTLVT